MNIYKEYERRCASTDRAQEDIVGHLPYLYYTTRSFNKPKVIELGVRRGNSTSAFLAGVQKSAGHLWSVDNMKQVVGRVPHEWHELGYWSLHIGDDLSKGALAFAPEKCDVLFIDTSHTYEQTLAELEAWAPRAKMVLCHDTELESVSRALDDYGAKWTNRPGCNGLGVIRQ